MSDHINRNPDWGDPDSMRANLLVTFGLRAGYMDSAGFIHIPGTLAGEDALAALAIRVVKEWEDGKTEAFNFDEHIETALLTYFPLPERKEN